MAQRCITRHLPLCVTPKHGFFSLLTVFLLLGCAENARAAKEQFERTKPHVNIVATGHVAGTDTAQSFDLSADLQFGPNRPTAGLCQFVFADGSVRLYKPVGATVLEGDQCLVFFLGGLPSGALDPTDTAIALLRKDPADARVILVKLRLPRVFPGDLEFEVPGDIAAPDGDAHRPAPPASQWFTTYYWHFRMEYPPQLVMVDENGLQAGFSASAKVQRDGDASGTIILQPPGRETAHVFEPLFGTAAPPTETGPGYIILLLTLADQPVDLDNLAVAIVRPHESTPGCDIWDFTSNFVRRSLVFLAEGQSRFFGGGVSRLLK